MNLDYDPDWPEPFDRPRLSRRERAATLAAIIVCYAAILVAALLSPGCATTPEGVVTLTVPAGAVDFVTNIVQRGASAWSDRMECEEKESSSAGEDEDRGEGARNSSGPAETSPSPVVLDFRYGGFKGGSAKEDSRCRISNLKCGKDSLSLHWDTKIPSDWHRGNTKKGPMIVIAAFYQDSSGRWVGGKFDWIDESRSTRSLENIHGGYGGWNGTSWTAAKKHAVCVVSADGKYRSNLLED